MKTEIILVGGGGHCRSCIDVIEQTGIYSIAGIIDLPAKIHHKVLGYEIIGTDADLPHIRRDFDNFLITVGQIKSPEIRIGLFQTLKELDATLPVIVSPLAYVSKHAKVGEGTIVMHQALINAGAQVGRNCIVNTKSLVEHDASVGDHCHIATSAVVNGGVTVEDASFLGSGAVSKEYITIGKRSVIGCNKTVK